MLQLTGGLATGALAGCLGFLPRSTPPVFENVTIEGQQIVVHLTDDTNADAIDLRSPSDELLHTASIGRQSTVRLSLFDNTNTPYPPGKYTLVAVETSGDEPQTLSTHALELTASISITDVQPIEEDMRSDYAGANPPPVAGSVQVIITNTGTLPVEIGYIGFTNGVPSPNPPPSQRPFGLYRPVAGSGRLIATGEQTTFESIDAPLQYAQPPGQTPDQPAIGVPKPDASWQQIKTNHCTGARHTATLVVVSTQGSAYRTVVTFEYGGQTTRHDPLAVDYACTNVSVVQINAKNTSITTSRS